jgi:hypothetical protein
VAKRRAKGKRDYAAEYKRRVERAVKAGLPKSVGRGHPPKNIVGLREAKFLNVPAGQVRETIRTRSAIEAPYKPFEQTLYDAGFRNFLVEARKEVLRRKAEATEKEARQGSVSQERFLELILEYVPTETEAYSLWFSPK